jgi:hypothetical protein
MLLSMPSFIRNCHQWLGIDINAWFSKELTSIPSHWWKFLIKESIDDNIKNLFDIFLYLLANF